MVQRGRSKAGGGIGLVAMQDRFFGSRRLRSLQIGSVRVNFTRNFPDSLKLPKSDAYSFDRIVHYANGGMHHDHEICSNCFGSGPTLAQRMRYVQKRRAMEVRQLGDVPFCTESTRCLFADFGATELWSPDGLWCTDKLWCPDGHRGGTAGRLGTAWRSNGDANGNACWDANRCSRESQLQRLQSLESVVVTTG